MNAPLSPAHDEVGHLDMISATSPLSSGALLSGRRQTPCLAHRTVCAAHLAQIYRLLRDAVGVLKQLQAAKPAASQVREAAA